MQLDGSPEAEASAGISGPPPQCIPVDEYIEVVSNYAQNYRADRSQRSRHNLPHMRLSSRRSSQGAFETIHFRHEVMGHRIKTVSRLAYDSSQITHERFEDAGGRNDKGVHFGSYQIEQDLSYGNTRGQLIDAVGGEYHFEGVRELGGPVVPADPCAAC